MVTDLRCPGCASYWKSLGEFATYGGGRVRALGLTLKATCPNCGEVWPVNGAWSKERMAADKALYRLPDDKEKVRHDRPKNYL